MWQEKKAAPARKENMRYRIYSASSLTDSLRSVVRLRRAVPAYWWGGKFLEDTWKILSGTGEGHGEAVFHRLRPPDKHHEI